MKKKITDLFIFMGQSNMAGRGIFTEAWPEQAPEVPEGQGYEFRAVSDPTRLHPLKEPFGVAENRPGGIEEDLKTGSLASSFAIHYYQRTGVALVAVSASKGGSSILEWQPGSAYLKDAMERLDRAKTFLQSEEWTIRNCFLLWCQGETDGDHGMPASEYQKYFRKMLDETEQHGITHCFMIKIGHYNGNGTQTYAEIREAQERIALMETDVTMVSRSFESMQLRGLMKDDYHYYQQAYNEVGREAAVQTAAWLQYKTVTGNEERKEDVAPMLSIIVPIYNAEKSLKRCIDSILGQVYRDFELILVNDGSKDSSGSICDSYAAQDARVRVIHKENSGVSDSRNLAISQARGKYIQFLDSDDWITSDASHLMVRAAESQNCDLVITDFYRVIGERLSQKGDIEEDQVMTREEFAEHMMGNPADFYYGVLWNKLFRREIIETHQLKMNSAISWCEDFMFNLEYIRYAERFYALQVPVYYYVKTKGSLASQGLNLSKTIKMKRMVFSYYNAFYKDVLDENEYEKSRLQIYSFLIDAAGDGVVLPWFFPGSKRLGNERHSVMKAAISGEGIYSDVYRCRKLLERYLEAVALKYDLKLKDISLMYCILQQNEFADRKELADYMGIGRTKLSTVLQKLSSRKLIGIKEGKRAGNDETWLHLELLPEARAITDDLAVVRNDYDETRFSDFTEDELVQFANLEEKMKQNIRRVLLG